MGCRLREVAVAALGVGAVVGVGDGFPGNGGSPSYPDIQLLSQLASQPSCSGEGGWRVGSEPETVAVGSSVAKEKEWTGACPEVCQSFLVSLFPS